MKAVKGVWTFNDVLTSFPSAYQENVNFTSNNKNYTGFMANAGSSPVLELCYVGDAEDDFYPYDVYYYEESLQFGIEVGWFSYLQKTIDFGTTEQMVSDAFYAWLVENTVSVENIKINITENGTTTLATTGKYCDRNIDVNVEVSSGILNDADKVVDGTISGAYVSDKVTSLRYGAFHSCANLTSVTLPNCTSIGTYSFEYCSNIESVDLPMCTTIGGNNAFGSATKLKTINLPNLTTIVNANRTFVSCESLEEFNAPNLISMGDTTRMFGNCTELKKVAFQKLGGITIRANTFYGCKKLDTLILGGDTLNPLENVNAFSNIPYIYVPDALVDTYKTATNWATFADKIKPISELEE